MKRINIDYAGNHYSVGGRDVDDLQKEIETIVRSGEPGWLIVNHGEGVPQEARLLITPGVALALLPIEDSSQA
jgi:hypothetical protein